MAPRSKFVGKNQLYSSRIYRSRFYRKRLKPGYYKSKQKRYIVRPRKPLRHYIYDKPNYCNFQLSHNRVDKIELFSGNEQTHEKPSSWQGIEFNMFNQAWTNNNISPLYGFKNINQLENYLYYIYIFNYIYS